MEIKVVIGLWIRWNRRDGSIAEQKEGWCMGLTLFFFLGTAKPVKTRLEQDY